MKMATKKCFKCQSVKSLDQFYAHQEMGDGHLNKCKSCAKRDVAERAEKLSRDPLWRAKERARCRDKQNKYRALGLAVQPSQATKRKWAAKNKIKVRAQILAQEAEKQGRITIKTACEQCGATGVKLEKHHPDYSKPLEVQHLCTKCHGRTRRLDASARC